MRILSIISIVLLMTVLLVGTFTIPLVRREDGGRIVYTFSWLAMASLVAASTIALAILWRFRQNLNLKLGLGLIALGLGLPLVHIPSMLLGYVVVDDDHFEARYGSWEAFARPNLRFDDLKQIRLLISVNADGRALITHLVCVKRSGETLPYEATYGLIEPAVPEILERARRHGVPIVEERWQL